MFFGVQHLESSSQLFCFWFAFWCPYETRKPYEPHEPLGHIFSKVGGRGRRKCSTPPTGTLLGPLWGSVGRRLGHLGAILERSCLGRPWGDLGWSWGGLWEVLGRLGEVLGGSWGPLGRSKIDQKSDPKIDPKSSRIRIGQKRSGATPVMVSEVSEAHRNSDPGAPENYQNRYRYD